MTTNYYNGFTNIPVGHPLHNRQALEVPYAPRWHQWFEDFDRYAAGDWVLTTVEGGGGDATEALGNLDGGVLVITNDVADNDLDYFQTVKEIYTFEAGKKLYFESRMKINEVIQSEFVMGLQIRDTDPLAVSDGVWFQSDDGDALVDFHSALGSSQTDSTGIYTSVADTYAVYGFYFNGVDAIEAWVGTTPTTMRLLATHGVTTLPTTELTVSFGVKAGEITNAKIMSVDWIYVAKERA